MTVKLLAGQHLEFLSLKGGCTGSSESTLVKMPHCWKSYVAAQSCLCYFRHIHRFWGATGSLWQSIWDYTYVELFNRNDLLFGVIGMPLKSRLILYKCLHDQHKIMHPWGHI